MGMTGKVEVVRSFQFQSGIVLEQGPGFSQAVGTKEIGRIVSILRLFQLWYRSLVGYAE